MTAACRSEQMLLSLKGLLSRELGQVFVGTSHVQRNAKTSNITYCISERDPLHSSSLLQRSLL